ncbi:MAG: hypothetical protein CMJ75_01470 [Planctomycetaceae bacterium]|nr:hypothetical protein [Planctomycetaceae bacterium]
MSLIAHRQRLTCGPPARQCSWIDRIAGIASWSAVLLALSGGRVVAQEDQQVESQRRTYVGFAKCISCHNSGLEDAVIRLPGGLSRAVTDDQWILYREFAIWSQSDKHGQAYAVLLNERSRKMGKLMGVREIHRDLRCLACHTGLPLADITLDEQGMCTSELVQLDDVRFGISCEGCHGSSGDRRDTKGWFFPHAVQPTTDLSDSSTKDVWRFLAPQEKQEGYGYTDLRSPANRARACLSCHLGDAPSGRVVTHEMYAAGHPPLPGFEIGAFVQQMPRHWRHLSEKGAQLQQSFLASTRDPLFAEGVYRPDGLPKTTAALVGAMVSLGQSVTLLADLAEAKTNELLTQTPPWPDLAQYDCFACHHELQPKGWRQFRHQRVGAPGRPLLREWPTALVRLAVGASGRNGEELQQRLNPLYAAAAARPYGDKVTLIQQARKVAAWATEVAADLEKQNLTPEAGQKLLSEICQIAADQIVDYDSARLMVWLFVFVDRELKATPEDVTKLFTAKGVVDPLAGYSPDDPTGKILRDIEAGGVSLVIRQNRAAVQQLPGLSQPFNLEQSALEKTLPVLEGYDARRFQNQMKALGNTLAP